MRVYNTLSRTKEEFVPREPGKVSMYVCGPTVYNHIHIGNARSFLSFDVIRRYLEYRGYDVRFVQNITDVDDKIINRANEEGRSAAEVAEEYTEAFIAAMRALGIKDPTVRPKATETIPEMIALIERLIAGGHAYESGGDVYFAVRSFPGVRQALRPRHRRDGDAGAHRRRRAQARPARLRAVEGGQARRAALAEPLGRRPARAGTSSARRCPRWSSGCPSTSTAAAATSSSRTTRTRSRSPRPRRASRSRTTGCTAACCRSTRRR